MRNDPNRPRYVEIDLLRTVAIVLMIVYHAIFDLAYYGNIPIDILAPEWKWYVHGTAGLFLLLVGVSFVLRSLRTRTRREMWIRTLRRSGIVLGAAMLVTITTALADPETYIRFGILHCIGVSMLFLPVLLPLKEWNIALGLLAIAAGTVLDGFTVSTALLLPFGLRPPLFRTLDYYPLLPWFGVIVIGLGLGQLLYGRGTAWRDRFQWLHHQYPVLTWPGRHALVIYMTHQPILLGFLFLVP